MIEKYEFPGYSVGVGSKGCVTFSPEKITDYVYEVHSEGTRTVILTMTGTTNTLFCVDETGRLEN